MLSILMTQASAKNRSTAGSCLANRSAVLFSRQLCTPCHYRKVYAQDYQHHAILSQSTPCESSLSLKKHCCAWPIGIIYSTARCISSCTTLRTFATTKSRLGSGTNFSFFLGTDQGNGVNSGVDSRNSSVPSNGKTATSATVRPSDARCPLLLSSGGPLGHLSEGSALCRLGGTVVHAAVNSADNSPVGGDAAAMVEGDGSLPLTVDYRARYYAFGRIPGSLNRRERHGGDDEVLVARVIDRAVRPLFPKAGYLNEVQLTVTLHAADGEQDPVVAAVNAASVALMLSRQPWDGPLGCVRVGLVAGELVVNPTVAQLEQSTLDLLYAGKPGRTLMVEAGGRQVPEEVIEQGMVLADAAIAKIVQAQLSMQQQQTKQQQQQRPRDYLKVPDALLAAVTEQAWARALDVYSTGSSSKESRGQKEGRLRGELLAGLEKSADWGTTPALVRNMAVETVLNKAFRYLLLQASAAPSSEVKNETGAGAVTRSDGRGLQQLRSITCAADVLPSVHGSAYFMRGDTHVLSTVTLGSKFDARRFVPISGLANPANVASTGTVAAEGNLGASQSDNDISNISSSISSSSRRRIGEEEEQLFMLHYDFPPYATGETGNATAVNRRSVGHGNLAEKALRPVLPPLSEFPYVVRVFAECTGSNGSSSMASVCAASLALFDAGVPLKAAVAGISVGLVTASEYTGAEGENLKFVLLKDILGSEDHHGDMDFKVAGSERGVTAIQLDVKLPGGVPLSILTEALQVAREGRLEILQCMSSPTGTTTTTATASDSAEYLAGEACGTGEACETSEIPVTEMSHRQQAPLGLSAPQRSVKPHALKAELVRFDPERKRILLGPGGEMLRHLQELYDVKIDVEEEGAAYIYGQSAARVRACRMLVEDIAILVKEGDQLTATVGSLFDYGLIVRINRAQEALLHVSDISHDTQLMKKPLQELVVVGQRIRVKVTTVDESTGLVKVSRKALLDPAETDALSAVAPAGSEADGGATYGDGGDGDDDGEFAPKFPVTPPKRYNRDFFRIGVATEAEIKQAVDRQV